MIYNAYNIIYRIFFFLPFNSFLCAPLECKYTNTKLVLLISRVSIKSSVLCVQPQNHFCVRGWFYIIQMSFTLIEFRKRLPFVEYLCTSQMQFENRFFSSFIRFFICACFLKHWWQFSYFVCFIFRKNYSISYEICVNKHI